MMSQKTYVTFSGVVFLLIAVGHLLRLIFRVHAVVGGLAVPVWSSALALVFFGFLAYQGLRLSRGA